MNIIRTTQNIFVLVMMNVAIPCAFCAATEITNVDAVSDGDTVRIGIALTSPVKPIIHAVDKPSRLIIDFPDVSLQNPAREIIVNHAGVNGVRAAMNRIAPQGARIVVGIDSVRPFGLEVSGNRLVVSILPHPGQAHLTQANASSVQPAAVASDSPGAESTKSKEIVRKMIAASGTGAAPQVEHAPVTAELDQPPEDCPATVRRRFKVKFVSGNTVYIDGGSNSGLQVGMNFDLRKGNANFDAPASNDAPIGAARLVGIATRSAIVEVGMSRGELQVGDWAELTSGDADLARRNILTGADNTLH